MSLIKLLARLGVLFMCSGVLEAKQDFISPQKIQTMIQKPIVEPVLKSTIEPYDSQVSRLAPLTLAGLIKPIIQLPDKDIASNTRFITALPQLENQPSHLRNAITQHNIQSAILWNRQLIHKTGNAPGMNQIIQYQHRYQKECHSENVQRFNIYDQYWQNNMFHNRYNRWYKWGFHGGYWYPLRPFFSIQNYFTYPTVQWFFVDDTTAAEYFHTYYASEEAPPSSCLKEFSYKNIYFPSDTLRDLLVEASAFPLELRCNFRSAVINLTNQLKGGISKRNSMLFSFHQNDIALTYYHNLENKAIVIVGFINQGKINIAFEGLLDLKNPKKSSVFIPDGPIPTDYQLQQLYQLNSRIRDLGGDPFSAPQEPSAKNAPVDALEQIEQILDAHSAELNQIE